MAATPPTSADRSPSRVKVVVRTASGAGWHPFCVSFGWPRGARGAAGRRPTLTAGPKESQGRKSDGYLGPAGWGPGGGGK
jgi:hypothetical protein